MIKKHKMTQVEYNKRWRHRHRAHAKYLRSKYYAKKFISVAKPDDLSQLTVLINKRKKQLSK